MKEIGLLVAVMIGLGCLVGKLGFDEGYRDAREEFNDRSIREMRKAENSRCIDGVVYNNTSSGYWVQTEKKCKVLP